MKNKRIKTLIVTTALVAGMAIPSHAESVDYWKNRQAKCHQIAETLRAMGFKDEQFSFLGDEWYRCKEEIDEINKSNTAATISIRDYFTEEEINIMATIMWNEANGSETRTSVAEIYKVGWCILNRYDDGRFGSTLKAVMTAKNQFAWYGSYNLNYKSYAENVLERYIREKNGEDVGRELPKGYLYFYGDGTYNHFY